MELLRVHAENYVKGMHALGLVMCSLARAKDDGVDLRQDRLLVARLRGHLNTLLPYCNELPMTKQSVSDLLRTIDSPEVTANWEQFPLNVLTSIGKIQERLRDELSLNLFFAIPANRRVFFDEPFKGWEVVLEKFPKATGDIEEMSKCFALSRYTACAFHSLQVAEWGILKLGKYIGVNDPKPGWDATYKKLKELTNRGHAELPAPLEGKFAFIEQISQRVESMKMAWRNKVNHAAGKLTVMSADFHPDIAEEIMLATRGFMREISVGITEAG